MLSRLRLKSVPAPSFCRAYVVVLHMPFGHKRPAWALASTRSSRLSDGMLSDEAVCKLAKLSDMDINKLRKAYGCKPGKRTTAVTLEDIEHKLEEGGPLLVPGRSSQFPRAASITSPNSKDLLPSKQFKSIQWAVETLESVKKLRCVAQRTSWLCSPRLLCTGISCEKCPRHWAGDNIGPAGFCARAGCLVSSVPVPSRGERTQFLCDLGLMQHNGVRSSASAAGSLK